MPVIINKVGGHRNEDALSRTIQYMISSNFFRGGNGRGIWGYSIPDIINAFQFVKEMYNKTDNKQVDHIIIGTKQESIIETELIEIAEAALNYFYSVGFQGCYAFHRGSNEDGNYLHIHMAINTISFVNGNRLYESFSTTSGLKNYLMAQYNAYQWRSVNDNSPLWEV